MLLPNRISWQYSGFPIMEAWGSTPHPHLCSPILSISPMKLILPSTGCPLYIKICSPLNLSEHSPPPSLGCPSCTIICREVSTSLKIKTSLVEQPHLENENFLTTPNRTTLQPENENFLTSP